MKKFKPLQIVGFGLILCGLVALLGNFLLGQWSQEENKKVLAQMQTILPPATPGATDQYSSMEMPSLQLCGNDYVALLEAPKYGAKLPVRSHWDALAAGNCPSRFYGTVYDGSLIIGGSGREGHLDFLGWIQNGDTLLVTDMTGAQFAYRVTKIFRASSAQQELLMDKSADLTLFAWNNMGLEYIIVRCAADIAPTN